MKNKKLGWILLFSFLIAFVSLSCEISKPILSFIFGYESFNSSGHEEVISQEASSSDPIAENDEPNDSDQWDIYQCDASKDVNFTMQDFTEETFYYEDGQEGATECTYYTAIQNSGINSISIIYYKHWEYGDESLRSSDQVGWIRYASLPPGETYRYESFIALTPGQNMYIRMMMNVGVIYDIPQCLWVRDGGVHFDILKIAEDVIAPCSLISPYSGEDSFPDITEGLIR